jgi:hypothetical protein
VKRELVVHEVSAFSCECGFSAVRGQFSICAGDAAFVFTRATHTYSVWWSQDIGWYGLSVPRGFARLQDFDRISVYEYTV